MERSKGKEINSGVLLVDLSKPFDCLPHSLIIAKAHTYGKKYASVTFLADYLLEQSQRIKINGTTSGWNTITKGFPKAPSWARPSLTSSSMTFSMMEYYTLIYNYTDDNTVLVTAANKEAAVKKIVQMHRSLHSI